MVRAVVLSVLCLLPAGLCAQSSTELGLKLGKVNDALFAQLPNLPKDGCVLVESVEAQSLAWRGGLRPFDIVLVPDAGALMTKLAGAKTVDLAIVRAGRELTLSFDPARKESAPANEYLFPKGVLKPGGPPAVRIQLQPLDNGRLSLVLAFYADNSGKMERLTYDGQLGDIERKIQADARDHKLPERVQDLVDVALKRVRAINQKQK